jgi:hypothetical protein
VGARGLLLTGLVALAAGCGTASPAVPSGPAAVSVRVTRGFGAHTLAAARAAPGQSAMLALRRNATVDTAYGGRFVTAINGVKSDKSAGWDWFYSVNGIDPGVGAADMHLHPGDREWWDYRYWGDFVGVPAVIGAWPEPFVHGLDGHAPAVTVSGPACADRLSDTLRTDGARLGTAGTFTVHVSTFTEQAGVLGAPSRWGELVAVHDGAVSVYTGPGGWRAQPDAAAVIVAREPGGIPGRSYDLIVAGRDETAACAAAAALADDDGLVRDAYAVALDADGHVVAWGGRP